MGERLEANSRLHGHDVHVRLGDRTYAAVHAFAEHSGLALNGCVRLLVERGLAAQSGAPPATNVDELLDQVRAVGQAALASLLAIEETRISQAHLFDPLDRKVTRRFTEEAANAARQRLADIEAALLLEAK